MRKIYQKTCFLWPVFYLINITNNLSHPGLFFFQRRRHSKPATQTARAAQALTIILLKTNVVAEIQGDLSETVINAQ